MADAFLYDYWRSSASYRVRIALNLAGLETESVSVDLVKRDHKSPEHLARNPQGFVPVLEIDGHSFTQSLAIVDYLDETRHLGLLPADPAKRAKARALGHAIAVDIHPVCNLQVIAHVARLQPEVDTSRQDWMQHFIPPGMRAFETLLSEFEQTPFCIGDTPGFADICLMPQIYNADRWGADYSDCQRIQNVAQACQAHPAFAAAHPDQVKPA